MKCLYCGQRLALLRKLTDSEFCSAVHRKLYQQEQERLALSRLIDAQKRFSTVTGAGVSRNGGKSPAGIQRPKKSATADSEPPRGHLTTEITPQSYGGRRDIPSDPLPHSPEVHRPGLVDVWGEPAFRWGYLVTLGAAPTNHEVWRNHAALRLRPPFNSPRLPRLPRQMQAALQAGRAVPHALRTTSLTDAGTFRQTCLTWINGVPVPATPRNGIGRLPIVGAPPAAPLMNWTWSGAAFTGWVTPRIAVEPIAFAPPVAFRWTLRGRFETVCAEISSTYEREAREMLYLLMGEPEAKLAEPATPGEPDVAWSALPMRTLGPLEVSFLTPSRVPGAQRDPARVGTPAWMPGAVPGTFVCDALAGQAALAKVTPSPLPLSDGERGTAPSADFGLRQPAMPSAGKGLAAVTPESVGSTWVAKGSCEQPINEMWGSPQGVLHGKSSFLSWPGVNATAARANGLATALQLLSLAVTETDCRTISGIRHMPLPASGETVAPAAQSRLADPGLSAAERQPMEPAGSKTSEARPPSQGWTASELPMLVELPMPAEDGNRTSIPNLRGPQMHTTLVAEPRLDEMLRLLAAVSPQPYTAAPMVARNPKTIVPEMRPWLPEARLSAVSDWAPSESQVKLSEPTPLRDRYGWRSAPPVWQRISHDVRWLALSLPIVVGLALYVASPRSQGDSAPTDNAVAQQWSSFRQSILKRAAIELSDDFRGGLAEWTGTDNWSQSWSYDPSGFVRTGPLALFRPTMTMTDYKVDFLGQIEKKSLGWAFRAADVNNYYAMKLVVTKPGPLPSVALERYAVIGGKEGPHHQVRLPMAVRNDTMYRVRVDVRGPGFTIQVQGQTVDYWNDDRLKTGGIGFFSGKGEQARIRWVEVSHQYDTLGRLCAFLAPYGMPAAREGGARQ